MAGGDDEPACPMYDDDADKIEAMFIVPTCGKPVPPGTDPMNAPACHNGNFAPRLDMAGMIADGLANPPSSGAMRLTCKSDKWIDKTDWKKSYVITKTNPGLSSAMNAVMCVNTTGKGMFRMPASEDTKPSEPLSREQYDCVRFYVKKLATQ